MRLASFNVENLTVAPDAAAPLAARLNILRPQLERLAADVLCLQEVDASKSSAEGRELKALRVLLEETAYRDFHVVSTVDASTGRPRDKHNLVILSRWPIRTRCSRSSTSPSARSKTPRRCSFSSRR